MVLIVYIVIFNPSGHNKTLKFVPDLQPSAGLRHARPLNSSVRQQIKEKKIEESEIYEY